MQHPTSLYLVVPLPWIQRCPCQSVLAASQGRRGLRALTLLVILSALQLGCAPIESRGDAARSVGHVDFISRVLGIWQSENDSGYAMQLPVQAVDIRATEVPISRMDHAFDRLYRTPFVQIRCEEVRLWLKTIGGRACDREKEYYLVRAIHHNALAGDFAVWLDAAGTLVVAFYSLGGGTVLPSAVLVEMRKGTDINKLQIFRRAV